MFCHVIYEMKCSVAHLLVCNIRAIISKRNPFTVIITADTSDHYVKGAAVRVYEPL